MRGFGTIRRSVFSIALATPVLVCSCAASPPAAAPKAQPVAQPANTPAPATDAGKGNPFIPVDAFAAHPAPAGKIVGVWASAYVAWPANEDPQGVSLVSPEGRDLKVKIGVTDFCNAGDESTVIVTRGNGDTVTLSTAGRAKNPFTDCHGVYKTHPKYAELFARTTYRPTPGDAPYGIGSQSHWRLVPYRSVAVKQGGQFANGTVLYIKKLAGKPIKGPDGTTAKHDGYVMVADIGDMTSTQLDFYKGATQNQTVPFSSDLTHLTDAVVVTDPAIISALRAEHHCVCASVTSP